MDVKEAIEKAKKYVNDIYADEQLIKPWLGGGRAPRQLDNHFGLFSALEHATNTSTGSSGEPWRGVLAEKVLRGVLAEKVLQSHHNGRR
jgi:hypothetical protein